MELEQAVAELQKITQTLAAAVAKLQGNAPVVSDADITRACHGMKARHALLLEVLLTAPTISSRMAGKRAGVAATTTRRLRAKWAEQFPGVSNTLRDREDNQQMQARRAERQYVD